MSRFETKAPYSVQWTEWFRRRLVSKEIENPEGASFTTHIEEAFDETYEFDGLSITQRPLRSASKLSDKEPDDELNNPEDEETLSQIFAYLSPIFGLPTRDVLKSGDSWKSLFKQLGKNLIGGWDSSPDISFKKKVWQWVVSPVKVLIILPLKILGFPLKLLLNFMKVFTEFLPLLISSVTAHGMGWALKTLHRLSEEDSPIDTAIELPLLPLAVEKSPRWIVYLKIVGLFPLYLLLGTVHIVFRIITLAGKALTSPEKSARMAFAYGRELNITVFGDSKMGIGLGRFLSNVVGGLGAVISIGITATLWLLTFPLLISAIVSAFPILLQAITWVSQLPPVLATMTWIAQTPLLTTSLGAVQGGLATMGLALSAAFGPAISSLAGLIGLKLSVGILAAGTTLGLITAPITIILSRVADELSNAWARPWPSNLKISLQVPKTPELSPAQTQELAPAPTQTPEPAKLEQPLPVTSPTATPPSATVKDFVNRNKSAQSATKIAAVNADKQNAAASPTVSPPKTDEQKDKTNPSKSNLRGQIKQWESRSSPNLRQKK